MAYIVNPVVQRALRGERIFRDRTNPLDILDDEELLQRFRFPRQGILFIFELIRHDIEGVCGRSHPVHPMTKLCAALRYYARGDKQLTLVDSNTISQASISRCITQVTAALIRHRRQFIEFPKRGHL